MAVEDWFGVNWSTLKEDATDVHNSSLGNKDTDLLTALKIPKMYQVRLHNNAIDITTTLPQNFSLQISSSWESNGNTVSDTGNSTAVRQMSALAFQAGTGSHLDFNLPFVFKATKDTKKEVVEKMRDLLKMVTPSVKGGITTNPDFNKDPLTLEIGTFLRIKPVIVDSINEEVQCMLDKDGFPISVTINISIKSQYIMTKEDIHDMFINL